MRRRQARRGTRVKKYLLRVQNVPVLRAKRLITFSLSARVLDTSPTNRKLQHDRRQCPHALTHATVHLAHAYRRRLSISLSACGDFNRRNSHNFIIFRLESTRETRNLAFAFCVRVSVCVLLLSLLSLLNTHAHIHSHTRIHTNIQIGAHSHRPCEK